MTWLLDILGFVRDRVIVAMGDIERGDEYAAAEQLDAAVARIQEALEKLEKAAA